MFTRGKIELFYGALRFSPFWMAIDVLLIGLFIFSWRKSVKETGWKVDFWYFHLTMMIFIPVFLMYPFSGSFFNRLATQEGYDLLEPYVERSFLITIIGYLLMWSGRFIYDRFRERCPLFSLVFFLRPLGKIVEKNISNKRLVALFAGVCICFTILIVMMTMDQGVFLRPRHFFFLHPEWRPLFNAVVIAIPLAISYLGLRVLQFKERFSKMMLLFLLLFSVALGLRSVTLMGLLTVFIYKIFLNKGQIRLKKLIGYGCIFVFFLLYIDHLRFGQYSPWVTLQQAFFMFFYGNHFCDVRDFAWTLACWDGEYLLGKSYVAGFISFIPRFLSSFREEWSYFGWTNAFVGLDSSVHPGLRPTIFGEMFMNFGYIGVMILGIVSGFFLRHADVKIKKVIMQERDVIKAYSKTVSYMMVSTLFITVGMWQFYLFVLINLCFYPFTQLRWRKAHV